jgi:hypothetical protein
MVQPVVLDFHLRYSLAIIRNRMIVGFNIHEFFAWVTLDECTSTKDHRDNVRLGSSIFRLHIALRGHPLNLNMICHE